MQFFEASEFLSPTRDVLEVMLCYRTVLTSGAPNGLFRKITVRQAQNRLRYSDLVAVKARDLFGETSPRTFETRGVISSYCFLGTLNMSKKVS